MHKFPWIIWILAFAASIYASEVDKVDRCFSFIQKKDFKSAEEACTEQLKTQKHEAIYTNRCYARIELGKLESALGDCSEAIKINPKFALAYNNRCYTKIKIGNILDSALEDCEKAVELSPSLPEAVTNICYILIQKQDWDKAIKTCTKAVKLDQKNEVAYLNRAAAYFAKAHYNLALSDTNEILKINPNCIDGWLNKCILNQFVTRDINEKIEDCKKAMQLTEKFPEKYNLVKFIYERFIQEKKQIQRENTQKP